jgi:hypothetical protein
MEAAPCYNALNGLEQTKNDMAMRQLNGQTAIAVLDK